MTYLKWSERGSWHIVSLTYRGGAVKTRCGRDAIVAGTLNGGGIVGPVRETSDTLPVNEKTCERCAVLSVRDSDPPEPANDEVGE